MFTGQGAAFGLMVRGADQEDPVPWPMADDGDALSLLVNGYRQAAGFVADRRDLAALLSEKERVWRGSVHVSLYRSNYPARLVGSLIMARDVGDAELAESILAKLSGESASIRESAQEWAKEFSKDLGFEVSLPI
jgi:hypothetical protein